MKTRILTLNSYLFIFIFFTGISFQSFSQTYEHFIIYGQSLSTGHQSWPPLSTENVEGNFMIGTQVWSNFGNARLTRLKPLVSKIADSDFTSPKIRNSNMCCENSLVGAVNHIRLKTNNTNPFIASSCGYGGTTIEELSKNFYRTSHYNEFTKLLDVAVPFTQHCSAIVFMQGEYNYLTPSGNSGLTQGSRPTNDKNEYKNLLLTLKNNMQGDIMNKYGQIDPPLLIVYQAGVQYTRGKELTIGMAQLEASNENDDIVCAGPVYAMTDREGHLDPNGYRWYGEMLGKAYYQTKYLNKPFVPLQPVEVARTNNPKEVKVKFYVPHLPLVLDELIVPKQGNYGFELFHNNAVATISNVRIEGDAVVLTSSTDLTGTIEVTYAGQKFDGNGNLRDSDPYQAFFNYLDLDKKNTDGSYVYERDASETTLRPYYEPKDQNGIIYDKPYPLYNFSVAFYYKLNAGEQNYVISVKPTPSEVNSVYTENVKLNYADNRLEVKNLDNKPIDELRIFDSSGKNIASFYKIRENRFFNISLSTGTYIVQSKIENQLFSTKILVN